MAIPKDEFAVWRDSPVTKLLKQDVSESISAMAAEILNRQSPNLERDQYLKGFLQGLKIVFDWEPEFIKIDEEDTRDAD